VLAWHRQHFHHRRSVEAAVLLATDGSRALVRRRRRTIDRRIVRLARHGRRMRFTDVIAETTHFCRILSIVTCFSLFFVLFFWWQSAAYFE
jgi:hypothetical protein